MPWREWRNIGSRRVRSSAFEVDQSLKLQLAAPCRDIDEFVGYHQPTPVDSLAFDPVLPASRLSQIVRKESCKFLLRQAHGLSSRYRISSQLKGVRPRCHLSVRSSKAGRKAQVIQILSLLSSLCALKIQSSSRYRLADGSRGDHPTDGARGEGDDVLRGRQLAILKIDVTRGLATKFDPIPCGRKQKEG